MNTTATKTAAAGTSDFARAMAFVLDHEGRCYEDVEGDPGGATKWGVTHIDYDQYRREHGLQLAPVRGATEAEIYAIYREHYWVPVRADHLTYPVALALFDCAVNCGLARAVMWLQQVLGVTLDAEFGPVTFAATLNYVTLHGAAALALAVTDRRAAYYERIGGQGRPLHKFLSGWRNRVADVRRQIGAPVG